MKTYPIEYYRSGLLRKWRWRVTADNGRIIGASSQGYFNLSDCEDNASLISRCLGVYSEADFVSFGEYLLSATREERIRENHPTKGNEVFDSTILREVYHADLENWKSTLNK